MRNRGKRNYSSASASSDDRIGVDSTPHASPVIGEADQAGSFFVDMKPPLTYEQQFERLREHGLSVADEDREAIELVLSQTNYYRLRGYWLTFEHDGEIDRGTTLEDVLEIARFDTEFRCVVSEMIEPIEIMFRTRFAYCFAHKYGPDVLEKKDCFRNEAAYEKSCEEILRQVERSKRDRVPCTEHNLKKYGALPVWALVEILSFGTVSKLYGNLKSKSLANDIAEGFNIDGRHLKSWVEHLTYVRNICAHHNRFYNRLMTKRPLLYSDMRRYDSQKEFPTLLVIRRMCLSAWPERWEDYLGKVVDIVERHPSVDLGPMGFPARWEDVLAPSSVHETMGL